MFVTSLDTEDSLVIQIPAFLYNTYGHKIDVDFDTFWEDTVVDVANEELCFVPQFCTLLHNLHKSKFIAQLTLKDKEFEWLCVEPKNLLCTKPLLLPTWLNLYKFLCREWSEK